MNGFARQRGMTRMLRPAAAGTRAVGVAAACAAILALAAGAAFAQDPVKETDTKTVRQPRRQDPPARRAERPKPSPFEKSRMSETPGAMIDRANHFLMQGRCAEAVPILERLTAEYPRIAAANEMLAGCYIKEGRAQDAASFLERCLEGEPGQFVYARDLGRAYMDLGRREDAVAVWRSLLAGDEKTASIYGQVAKMEQEAGLYDEAIETLRAGARFKDTEEYYSREIVRLERIIGREEDAFRDALLLIGRRQGAFEGEIRGVAEIFRESKKRERLVALLDSMTEAGSGGSGGSGVFRTLRTILLVEDGRYDDARRHLFGADGQALREDELYALLIHLGRVPLASGDGRLASFRDDLMQLFLERFGTSAFAPHVRLMAAEGKTESARGASGPGREKLLGEALALCDAVKRSGPGAPFFDEAAILKARVYFEDMHKPEEALAELSNAGRRNSAQRLEAEELRGRILLASGNWKDAAAELGRLAADADTSVAFLGRYGLGKLAFLAGRYEESVKTLSELAEKHPASPWANDALELAMDVKGAMAEDPGALGLYRAGVLARSRGESAAALDSLAALGRRFPESSLAPRALFAKAEIEAESGALEEAGGGAGGSSGAASLAAARADFTRLVESHPLHELAPRALERLAELDARENPAEALSRYSTLMERYPEYPFMERVRERYVALGKTAAPPAPEKGSR